MNPQATFDLLFSISTAVAIAVRRVRVPYTVALVLVGLVRGMFHFVAAALRPTRERLPSGWPTVLTWGGLRGALAMVLALALPLELPHRDQLIAMTFGVVLLSLAFQGMSMAWLPSRLGLVRVHSGAALHERARVTLRAVDVSLQELARLRRSHEAPPAALDAMQQRIEARAAAARQQLDAIGTEQSGLQRGETVRAVRRLLLAERAELTQAYDDGAVSHEVLDRLTTDVDRRLGRLDAGEFETPDELLASADLGI